MAPNSILIITYYVAGLLLNTLVAVGLAIIILRGWHKPGSLWLGLLFLASAWWSLTILGEILADTLPAKIWWSKILYPGAVSVPVLMFLFVLNYCRQTKWLAPPYRFFYWIVPLIAVILTWTNEWHQLIWTGFTPRLVGGSHIFVYEHGPAYWIIVVYSYLLVLAAVGLLIQAAWQQTGLQRRQAVFLLLIILLPWLADFSYNLNILPGLDFTVFGLTLSGLLMIWNLSRLNLLQLMPMAGERIFEVMQQAVVVLDEHRCVASFNPAAQGLLGMLPDSLGRSVSPILAQCLDDDFQTTRDLEWPGPPPRTLSTTVTPLTNRKNRCVGYLIICRDITTQKQAQHEKWERQLALAVLEERQQYSNELHTETRQVLEHIVSLAHSAAWLLEEESLAAAAASIAHLVEIARGSGADIDEFIENLPVASPRQTGFFQAMAQYINHFSQTHTLPITFTHPAQPADHLLPAVAQIQLLRIMQDVLLHTARYMQAEAVQVVISTGGHWVQTVITLQGSNFGGAADQQAVLSLLEQRAASVRGNVEIRSIPGQGSHVIIQLPRRELPPTKPFTAMRILLVDDHSVLLAGFKELLERRGAEVVGMATNGEQAINLARQIHPDVILMDIRMPGMSGLEATRRIKTESPQIKIVMLTVSQDREDLFEALRSGASGYLLKTLDPEQFFDLLVGVVNGDMPLAPDLVGHLVAGITHTETAPDGEMAMAQLTSQQLDVLRLIAKGSTYREVGEQLHLSEHTIRYHVEQIRSKLNVSNRAEAVARAIQLGLVESSD